MDAGKPKKKRSELELLLGNSDAGGLASFSPRLPALSIGSPALAEATAESDEQLARRLHEELNGTRLTRRGSRAVTEDGTPLSPTSRGIASPHVKPKAETPKAHGGQQGGPGRASLPSLPSISESAPAAAGTGDGATAAEATTAEVGGRSSSTAGASGGSGPSAGAAPASEGGGGGEAVKRKRNTVPARELHLLLQQASSTAGRGDSSAFSPTRGNRAGALAHGRAEPSATSSDAQHSHQTGSQSLPRRDSDRSQTQHNQQQQPIASSVSAPVAAPPSPGAPWPPPPSLLPPKLKQRYLAGLAAMKQLPASASASASNDAHGPEVATARGSGGGGSAAIPTATAATPSCVLSGARNSLLSGQSLEGSSVQSQSESPFRGQGAAGAGATHTPPEAATAASSAAASAVSLAAAGLRPPAAVGPSVGGCSSTDETENDTDNGCAAAVAGAKEGGPSATSPKASLVHALQLPPPLPASASQQQRQADGRAQSPDLADDDSRPQCQASLGAGETAAAAQTSSGQGTQGHSLAGPLKVPKLPMIQAGRGWYRGRLMRESADGQRVLLDVPGAPSTGDAGGGGEGGGHAQQHQPFWLPVASDRIWRGSYKGKDWKYLGDGAWEPKPAAFKRGKQGSSSNGLPLPLPSWAVDGASAGANAEAADAQPSAAAVAGGAAAATTASGQRSKRDRGGWSSVDNSSDDADAAEEQQPQQQAAGEGPSTRSGQRPHRRSSPAIATSAGASAGSGKGAPMAAGAAAAAPPGAELAPAPTSAAASGSEKESDGAAVTGASAVADTAAAAPAADCGVGAAKEAAPACDSTTAERSEAECSPAVVAVGSEAKAKEGSVTVEVSAREETETAAAVEPKAPQAGAEESPVIQGDEEARGSQGGASVSASVDCGGGSGGGAAAADAVATTAATKMELGEEAADDGTGGATEVPAGDGSEAEIGWAPGVAHPRAKRPRRARRRRQPVRTPFDGMQFPLHNHHNIQSHHNPYAFYPGLSGEESGGDDDASDAEHGAGRRGSGDGGAAAPHHGSRRRAAARAAAVAAAAARAEAEAEEEEQEEILMGRRPPRRDRFQTHSQHGGGAAGANRRHQQAQHPNRARSAGRGDYYLYGDSSGNLDAPYSGGDAAAHGHASSARPRAAGSRGNSQPAPESGSGGSGAWQLVHWQAAGGQMGEGGAPLAPQAPPRNRRKGKPSRSRMDGEGDAWCRGEEDWELEGTGGVWARMPEVLRRLYYAPCPAVADGGDGTGGSGNPQQQQSGGDARAGRPVPHRQSGGGAYFGALHGPNKRRRVYDEDATISPDDMELEMEVDDHEHDADYLPPYGGSGGSHRSSGLGGGRRCSLHGGGASAKRQRSGGDPFYHLQHHHYQHHSSNHFHMHQMGQYGEAATARRHIIVGCCPPGWGSGAVGAAGASAISISGGGSGGCIPAGLAGLLEAALGQDAAGPGTDVHADGGVGPLPRPDVKMESRPVADGAAGALMATGVAAGGDAAAADGQNVLQPPMPPGDPYGAHVALSDSSAAPSGADEGKCGAGCAGSGAATAPAGSMVVDASGPTACADGGAAMAGTSAGGGSSPPQLGLQPMGQLRPNTPTRAKRTGRPPSVALGAGSPLPKLPALSCTASLRLQMAGTMGPVGPASSSAAADDLAAAAAAAATAAADPLLPWDSVGGRGWDVAEAQEPADARMVQAVDASSRPTAGGCEGQGVLGGCGAGAADAAAAAGVGERDGVVPPGHAACQRGASLFSTAAAIAAARGDYGAVPPAAKPDGAAAAGGGDGACGAAGCCVMDAIGALQYDNKPAMQQLATRAQLELDSIGLVVAAQRQLRGAVHQDEQQLHPYQRLTSGRGGGGGSGRGSGLLQYGSLSGAASPTPATPDPFIASLPSVEVVVGLFSARMPLGSAQQALADLVAGAAALPLFR